MKQFVTLMLLAAFALSGCAGMGNKEGVGTVLGAGAGAVVGSQFGGGTGKLVGTAIGTLAGAMIGGDIGRSLDKADQLAMQNTAQSALENAKLNTTSSWKNPDSGNYGTITPTQTFQKPSGEYCREYTQTVTIAGKDQQMYGTACRQPDGTWVTVK